MRSKGPYLIVSWIHLNAARRERSIVDRPWVATAAPDPNREYLALLSYLPLKSYRKTFDLFRRAQAVAAQLANTPGLIGFTFRAKILGHRFWTLSVWEDERALMAFVGERPHVGTMDALRPHMGDVGFFRWKVRGTEVPLTWDDAMRHADSKFA